MIFEGNEETSILRHAGCYKKYKGNTKMTEAEKHINVNLNIKTEKERNIEEFRGFQLLRDHWEHEQTSNVNMKLTTPGHPDFDDSGN